MTVLVGVKCTDGVVIGADSSATSSAGRNPVVPVPTDKLAVIGDRIILAGTGSVGLGQRFHNIVSHHWDQKEFQKPCVECTKSLAANGIQDFQSTGVRQDQHQGFNYGALLGAIFDDRPHLIEFGLLDMQPEIRDGGLFFVSMGSGQLLADPFLAFISRVLWKNESPNVKQAIFGVYWALEHTIKYAPGGVGQPTKISVLQRVNGHWLAEVLSDDLLAEQSQHIDTMEEHIAVYPSAMFEEAEEATPPPAPA